MQAARAEQGRFETEVRLRLDGVLNDRGFRAGPQAEIVVGRDGRPLQAIVYESDPESYANRYPRLRARFDGDVPCIDLWIERSPGGEIRARLEFEDVHQLLLEVGIESHSLAGDVSKQLAGLARAIATLFDAYSGVTP